MYWPAKTSQKMGMTAYVLCRIVFGRQTNHLRSQFSTSQMVYSFFEMLSGYTINTFPISS